MDWTFRPETHQARETTAKQDKARRVNVSMSPAGATAAERSEGVPGHEIGENAILIVQRCPRISPKPFKSQQPSAQAKAVTKKDIRTLTAQNVIVPSRESQRKSQTGTKVP